MLDREENYLPEEEIIPRKPLVDREKIPRFLLLFFLFFLICLISVISFTYFSKLNRENPLVFPTPNPLISTPTPILNQSSIATASAVLDAGNKTQDLEKSLDNLDIEEKDLTFPIIDFNINFNQPK